MGRFINADNLAYLGVDGTLHSYNLFAYCGNNPINKFDTTGKFGIAIGLFIGGSAIFGALAGAFVAATTGGNILEGIIEGAALGAVAATATVFVPELVAAVVPSAMSAATVSAISTAATFATSATAGMGVDYVAQRVSHELGDNSHTEFDLDEGRLLKTGVTTGIAGVVPTFGEPGASVINSIGSLVIGFDATFINASIEIAITQMIR